MYTIETLKRNTVIQGKEFPKGSLLIRGCGQRYVCSERPKDALKIRVYSYNKKWVVIYISVLRSTLAKQIVDTITWGKCLWN